MERLIGVDEDAGLLAQVFELGVELGDAVLQTRDQEVWCRRGELGGLELVSGLGSELVEGGNGERTGAAGQGQASGRCQSSNQGQMGGVLELGVSDSPCAVDRHGHGFMANIDFGALHILVLQNSLNGRACCA